MLSCAKRYERVEPRMTDAEPPLWVKIVIGIGVAVAAVFVGALWLAWKFTIGLLMILAIPVRIFGAGSSR